MSIRLNTLFNNANLPVATPLSTQIKAIPGFKNWFQADAKSATLDGSIANAVTAFVDLGGSADTFTQPTGAMKAVLTPAQAGAFSGAVFDGTNDFYTLAGTAVNFANPWSAVVVFKQDPTATGAQNLFGSFESPTKRTILNLGAPANLFFQQGNGTLAMGQPPTGVPHCAIISSGGGVLRGRLDGLSYGATAHDNNVGTTTAALGSLYAFGGGQQFKGAVMDVMLFTSDILATNAYVPIEGYAKNVYGIGA